MSGKLTRLTFLIIFTFILATAAYFAYFYVNLSLNNYVKETMNLYSMMHKFNKEHEILFLNKYNDFSVPINEMNNNIASLEKFFDRYKKSWPRKIFIRRFKEVIEPFEQQGNDIITEFKDILTSLELFKDYKLNEKLYFLEFTADYVKNNPGEKEISLMIDILKDSLSNNKLNISFFTDAINTYYADMNNYNIRITGKLFYLTILVMGMIIFTGLFLSGYLLFNILKNINKLSGNFYKISKDELTEDVVLNTGDELDEIANNVKSVLSQSQNLSLIKNYIGSLDQINETVINMKNSIKEELLTQKQQFITINNEFKQLIEIITTVSDNSLKTNFITLDTKHKTTNSSNTIKETIESFKTLSETATKIFGILKIINSITEQTELLSLSASIEAARAGEIGKGFNIVANEIRKLSDSTIISTKEISNFARMIIKIIKSTIGKSETSNEALNTIENSIDYIVNSIGNITDVAEQGMDKCNNIQNEVSQINECSLTNFNNMEKLENSSKLFSNKVDQLIKLSGKFKLTKQLEKSRKVKLSEV